MTKNSIVGEKIFKQKNEIINSLLNKFIKIKLESVALLQKMR